MDWEPIETAPKDGRYIFLYEKYSEVPFVGRWSEIDKEWTANKEHIHTNGDAIVVDWFEQELIAHWMPMMDLPEV